MPIVVPITNLPASGEAESDLSTTPKLFCQPVRELCHHHHGPTSWVPGPAKPHCSGVARRSDLLTDGGAGQCRGVEGARSGCLVDRSAGCKTGAAATSENVGGSMVPPVDERIVLIFFDAALAVKRTSQLYHQLATTTIRYRYTTQVSNCRASVPP